MNHLKVLCALVVIGICTSNGVRGEMPDTAKVVRRLVELGPVAEISACADTTIGRDTSWYWTSTRRIICNQMQKNCVIKCVRDHMNHPLNILSDEDPGDTKVFTVIADGKDLESKRTIVGFHCKAKVDQGSKSFVVASFQYTPTELGYVAFVPREYVLERT